MKYYVFMLSVLLFGCQSHSIDRQATHNYLQGIAKAKEMNKPIFLYFTCWGCVGNNELHEDLITSKAIEVKLMNDFVFIELYIDDRAVLTIKDTLGLSALGFSPAAAQKLQKARNIGNVNAIIQADLFGSENQPNYIITDAKGNTLEEPFGYTGRDKAYFLSKLEAGRKVFEQQKH